MASAEQVGFKLYLESATFSSGVFVLRFATYRGKDRTSDQTDNLMVRFTPQLDSLNDVKDVRLPSTAGKRRIGVNSSQVQWTKRPVRRASG